MYITIGGFRGKELVSKMEKAPIGSIVHRLGVDNPTIYKKQTDKAWGTDKYHYRAHQWLETTGVYLVKYKMTVEEELD